MPTIQDTGAEIVTEEMAELWKNERIRLSEEISDISAQHGRLNVRLRRLNDLLKTAAELRPEIQDWLDVEDEKAMGGEAVALTDAIKRVLAAGKGQPVQRNQIPGSLPQHGYSAARLQANPNYFHTALRRLVARKEIEEGPPGAFRLKQN